MERVLVLSKDPFGEKNLQELFQRLNMEVYCSSSLLSRDQSCADIISYFSLIVISETISTIELQHYLPRLKKYNVPIFRRGNPSKIRNSELAWIENEVDGWIDEDAPISDMIENVAEHIFSYLVDSETSEVGVTDSAVTIPSKEIYAMFMRSLSKNEKELLINLYNAKGRVVPRETLCQLIWESPSTPSNLSQLSSLIVKLKAKISSIGFDDNELQTLWGKGYRIEEELYAFLKKHGFPSMQKELIQNMTF